MGENPPYFAKLCSQCGAALKPGEWICEYCGTEFVSASPSPSQSPKPSKKEEVIQDDGDFVPIESESYSLSQSPSASVSPSASASPSVSPSLPPEEDEW